MDTIFENGFARMYGPLFLLFYAVLAGVAFVFVRYFLPEIIGKVKKDNDIKLPEHPDPYEIAFIRGAEIEVLSLVIYNLVKRNYFILNTYDEKTVVYVDKKKNKMLEKGLNAFELIVYDCLDEEWRLNEFINYVKRNTTFKSKCEKLNEKLEAEQFIWSDEQRSKFLISKFAILIFLSAISFYKIEAAKYHGHSNIGFLLVFTIISCFLIYRIKVDFLITSKGEKRMDQLKSTFRFIQGNKLQDQPLYLQQLLLATYGFALLQYSNFGFLYDYFSKVNVPRSAVYFEEVKSSTGGDGSSGGCGGGGGGCGGGCGGCGGCS